MRPAAWDRLGHLLPGGLPALGTKVHKVAGVLGASDPLDAYHSLVVQWDPQEVMARPVSGVPRPAALDGGPPLDSMLLADQLGVSQAPDQVLIPQPLTHQELANLVGATRETVTKILNDMKERGLLSIDQHRITLLRKAELMRALM